MIFTWLRNRRRRRLLAAPFSEDWEHAVRENVRLWERLDDDRRDRIRDFVRVFVAEKYWEGCNGLEMTPEVQVTIAAHAGLLVSGFEPFYFDRLKTLLVYPERYLVKAERQLPGGVVRESNDVRLGEAWSRGPVILAWEDVLEGGRIPDNGRNVVLHEFAHLLDMADGENATGMPFLPTVEDRERWTAVMRPAFREHVKRSRRREPTLLSRYGATNEAEFFAVATETFFEQPHLFREELPEVYDVLSRFYRQDPVEWTA